MLIDYDHRKDLTAEQKLSSLKRSVQMALDEIANTTGSSAIADTVYPVGSIYMSVNSTSPATLFGGTWEQIKGKFLIGEEPSTYAFLCAENDTFTLTRSANIRFGKGTAWSTTTLAAGTYTASASSLGVTDPCSGIVKVVEIELAAGATGGELNHTLVTAEMPSHQHSHGNGSTYYFPGLKSISGRSGSFGLASGSNRWGFASNSGYSDLTISNVTGLNGGQKEHNNMPPFLTVYMWKRTA